MLYDCRRCQARRMVGILAHFPRVVLEAGLEVEVLVLPQGPTRVLPVRGVQAELRVQVFEAELVVVVVTELSLSPSLWEQRWVVLVGGGHRRY